MFGFASKASASRRRLYKSKKIYPLFFGSASEDFFNFYAPRYCSASLDYAAARFGISNGLSVFTTNALLSGESFLLASGFC